MRSKACRWGRLIKLHQTISSCIWVLSQHQCAAETSTLVILYRVNVKEFILQIVEVVVIKVEASFQRTIRHTSLAFQEGEDLFEDFVKCHGVLLA
jgi:hypothetical protein